VALIETTGTAAVAFAATNVDDLVVLSVLFARREPPGVAIVAGQALGFALLVAASLAVAGGLLALPEEVVGLLGLVPLALGIRGLVLARRARDGGEAPPAIAGVLGVASVTVANGADNVAVYAPLFATLGSGGFALTVLIFGAGVAVWCAAGRLLGSHPAVVRAVERAGDLAVPVVLIALGVFIVLEAGLL
jgi:cadmium resistance protein CadD (predicted permease)